MQTPLRITMRDLPPSEAIEGHVRQHAEKLEKLCTRLTACHVTIASPHRHKTHGKHFHVRIDLAVPGGELVVDQDRADNKEHENAYAAVDAAFHGAERVLRDHQGRQRAARRTTA